MALIGSWEVHVAESLIKYLAAGGSVLVVIGIVVAIYVARK